MDTNTPVSISRTQYQKSAWSIEKTHLHFTLEDDVTTVYSELTLHCLENVVDEKTPALRLDGIQLELESVSVNSAKLHAGDYTLDEQSLTLTSLPRQCVLGIRTRIFPQNNTSLEGLYRSSGNFCTQCEAEGFRKITYYLDRPDVLSVFDVTIEASQAAYPVLLSNGNLVESRALDNGRHLTRWHDPHPKPCYLFALVAGQLSVIEDSFVTASGKQVLLQIYVQEHNINFCDFAMQALKRSMLWDEEQYGFEYDLERFMIVAVDDFNMGAMENKGLNVFNSRYVLADADTSTDSDFLGVESVIAHEYFHNWTGNRITCRDWFQLSLKEGLTVFRDQCFSSDMHSPTVKRIEDVRLLRARQFAEDAGPMAHPIRPDSYIEINNFYTVTVYEKGAEVIRMLHTLLGPELWRRGIDEYVRQHDGSATTCDAFIDALQSVTNIELEQFRLWYSTAGTPRLDVTEHYDAAKRCYQLTLTQHTPDTPAQSNKPALHIPMKMGLLDERGNTLPVAHAAGVDSDPETASDNHSDSALLQLRDYEQTFTFNNIESRPTASLLRGFSAPVKLVHALDDQQLALLIAHDTDEFNRWEAIQRLGSRIVMTQLDQSNINTSLVIFNEALETLLAEHTLDAAFKAQALQLPSIDTLAASLDSVDYQALGAAYDCVQAGIASYHEKQLRELVLHSRTEDLAAFDDRAIGRRQLANTALSLLSYLEGKDWPELARAQFGNATNMSDRLASLACLCHTTNEYRAGSLEEFHALAQPHKLVMDKWFAVQAMSRREQVIDDVIALYTHDDFDISNPNRVRALVASFAMSNPIAFHAEDGQGYAFLAERVLELDPLNPQLAAALVTPLMQWRRLYDNQQTLMRNQLDRMLNTQSLSRDVFEKVTKSLN